MRGARRRRFFAAAYGAVVAGPEDPRAPPGRRRRLWPTRTAPPGSSPGSAARSGRARVDLLVRLREIRGLLRQDRRDRVGRRVPAKSPLARQHLVQDRPESEEIAALVGGLPAHLLGRHVPHRPQHHAGLRSARYRPQVRLAALVRLRLQLRQPEVQDLDPAVLRQKQVLGLQVPVDDPLLVRRGETLGDLHRVLDRLAHGHRARASRLRSVSPSRSSVTM